MSAIEQVPLSRNKRSQEEKRKFINSLYELVDAANKYRMPRSREELKETRVMKRRVLNEIDEELRTRTSATFRDEKAYRKWRRDARTAKALTEVELTFLNRAERVMDIESQFRKGALDIIGPGREV